MARPTIRGATAVMCGLLRKASKIVQGHRAVAAEVVEGEIQVGAFLHRDLSLGPNTFGNRDPGHVRSADRDQADHDHYRAEPVTCQVRRGGDKEVEIDVHGPEVSLFAGMADVERTAVKKGDGAGMFGAVAIPARHRLFGTGAVLQPRVEIDETPARPDGGAETEPSGHALKLSARVEIVAGATGSIESQHALPSRPEARPSGP